MQFVRALRNRFGALHRVSGRIFVLSGAILGLSALSILVQVTPQRTPLVDIARGLFGLALLIALSLAMAAIRDRDFLRHRAWAIRAYSVGMGLGTVALVFFPIYIVTGQPPIGLRLRHPLRRLMGPDHRLRRGVDPLVLPLSRPRSRMKIAS